MKALARAPMIGQVKLATRAEAELMDREAIAIVGEMESSWLRLGKIVKRVIDSKAYKALGFATEGAWLEARVRGSVSKVFAAVQCVRALEGVPEAKLLEIGTVNANMLAKLPEKIRKLPEWIDRAATESTKDFRESVQVKLGINPDEWRNWSRPFPKDVCALMDGAEAHLAKKFAFDIVKQPGLRGTIWERLAVWVMQVENIEVEMGGE